MLVVQDFKRIAFVCFKMRFFCILLGTQNKNNAIFYEYQLIVKGIFFICP